MPFTFSHPAIVFPVRWIFGNRVSLTALVAGSVAPDFEKFLKMDAGNTFSHTWHGIFWFNVPFAILLGMVFHGIVRDPLIENLPEIFRKRLYPYKGVKWFQYLRNHVWIVIYSAIIGAGSHVVWDDLTHFKGKVARLIPVLTDYKKTDSSIFLSLDNISTIAGALFLLGVVMKLPVVEVLPKRKTSKIMYWGMILLFAGFIIAFRLGTGLDREESWELLFTSISALLISLVIISFSLRQRNFR